MNKRRSGILLHPSSLSGRYGIGTFGQEARDFIHWLQKSKQTVWQILPLGPTDGNNSPYQCYSAFAGNPLLISLDELRRRSLLDDSDLPSPIEGRDKVEFSEVEEATSHCLYKAYIRFEESAGFHSNEYLNFWDKHWWWLEDYSLFMSCVENEASPLWQEWDEGLKLKQKEACHKAYFKYREQVWYHRFVQFIFYQQWFELKQYANDRGIKIFGDLPLYVSLNSVDVWANQSLFLLDKEGNPMEVGGVPPDYFSAEGQLWGNPVFDWDALKKNDYQWWMARLHANLHLFDWLRIDHFRGFESFWSVPAEEKTAINGYWRAAHGDAVLRKLKEQLGALPIVAEDLGTITKEVHELRTKYALPGMKVLQFGYLDGANCEHLPHNFDSDFVVYTGTHDNNTTRGWLDAMEGHEQEFVQRYFDSETPNTWQMIRLAEQSVAQACIIPMQDILELDGSGRMNTPGVAHGNWQWKMKHANIPEEATKRLRTLTETTGRE